jgi:proline iminopeptidase
MRAGIRDTEIYFDIDGVGLIAEGPQMRERPVAFIVHGGPGADHTGLKVACASLAERMQLVHFDHRGHGRSARGNPATYTLDENVQDMEALRRYLGVGRIVSIGTSYGGMVAMAHAARYPDSVSHLILVATAAHAGFIERSKELVRLRGTPEQVALCDELWDGHIDSAEKLRRFMEVMGSLYSLKHDPALAKDGLDRASYSPEPLNRAYAPDGCMRRFDLRPELPAITAATLVLAGRHDWICPPEFSLEIHELIAGSDLRIFEASSHLIRADEPQNFLDAIAGFLVYTAAGNRHDARRGHDGR